MDDPATTVAEFIARIGWLPAWAQSLLLVILAVGVASAVHALGVRIDLRQVLKRAGTRSGGRWCCGPRAPGG